MNRLFQLDDVDKPAPCPKCRSQHVVLQPFHDRSTAERLHLYMECKGKRYFVGQLPDPKIRQA